MKIRRRITLDLPAVLLLLVATVASAADFQAVGAPHCRALVTPGFFTSPGICEWTYQATVGKSPFDKIALHRVAKGPNPPAHPDAVVLYLPGTNMNGEVALEDPRYSFQVYLAAHDVDVWSLDYRTHFIPPQTPQSDLSELAGWSNDLFETDIDAAAKFVSGTTGRGRLFVAGFSRGVEFAYLYAAMHPERVAGIIAIDGFIPTHPMRVAPLEPGQYADDVAGKHLTFDKRRALMQMVIDNPDQPAPIPKYKTARENLEHVMYDAAPGNGAFSNMQGGYSDPVVLAKTADHLRPLLAVGAGRRESVHARAARVTQGVENPGDRVRQHQLRRGLAGDGRSGVEIDRRARSFIYKVRQLGPSRRVGRYQVGEPRLRADCGVHQAA